MTRYLAAPADSPSTPRIAGVVLLNLGTPDAPTKPALKRYLGEFLSDPRIIEGPAWWRWILLHGVILRLRPVRSARLYARIWDNRGSPLLFNTEDLARNLESALHARRSGPIVVRAAMRYGSPSLAAVLRGLAAMDLQRLLVLPLFPQYSATTTASGLDALAAELARWRRLPEVRTIGGYHDDPRYIEALARRVEAHWQREGRAEKLLLSFHGIPERYVRAGDPYFHQCHATARLLRERLGVDPDTVTVAFQSRVGRAKWLRPYTDETLARWVGEGVRAVQVLCPGFAVDCLETLEEVALRYREQFLTAGGERFEYIPALNAGLDHAALLADLVLRHASGWPEFDTGFNPARETAQREAERKHRADFDARR
ncbi:MAG: ferrochelatase [Lysobacterales bacterium]